MNVIGLTGRMGAGKDEVFRRLQELYGEHAYRKASFAAPLKESAAALFNISVAQIEAMKNEPQIRVTIVDLKGAGRDLGRSFSIREMLQRYGTEAHRDVFGEDFWVDAAMRSLDNLMPWSGKPDAGDPTIVFTDVRFENEARAIRDAGGHVYEVIGADADTGEHPSEAGVPEGLIEWALDNSYRPDRDYELMSRGDASEVADARALSISALDDEVAKLHAELTA